VTRALLLAAVLFVVGCSDGVREEKPVSDAVLYTIGLSTDPYGQSDPRGFGVARGLVEGKLRKVEIHDADLGAFNGANWVDRGQIVVPRKGPPLYSPLLFRYTDGRLERIGATAIPGGSAPAWSTDGSRVAFEPPRACRPEQRSLYACYRASGEMFVARSDGSRRRRVGRGHVMGWTPDGRLAFFRSYQRATPEALDIESGQTDSVLPGWRGGLPVWSPDRRYAAGTFHRLRIVRADGAVVQTIRSRFTISMFTWSPTANRLAYTTSGFPDPHELFVVDSPPAKPRLLYKTGDDHFAWVTWSPDGKWLLLDEEHHARWLLIRVDRPSERRVLPRLGGRPLWCCPTSPWTQ
jgi:WD40 repeat protein